MEACKGNTRALEGQNASLLQHSLDLEREQTALKQQVQSLQRDLTSEHAQQAASSQTELAQAAAAVALLKKQLRQTEAREEVSKRIVLLMGEQQNALTGEKSQLETDVAAAQQANKAHAASIQAADTMIAQHAASLAAAKAEAKQTFDQHGKVLAAAEAAAKQAADAADLQASNHLAAMHTVTQAAKTEAMAEAAQSYAADRASWAAEKADLLEKLQAANAMRSVMPDAHASQLYAELASTQQRVRSAEQQVADTHVGSTPVTNAQISRQHLAADSNSPHAQVTATLARADALSSQHGQSSVLGAVQQPDMQLQGMPREGACRTALHEHSSHGQQSDSHRTIEQVMQQLQQLQESCRQMHETQLGFSVMLMGWVLVIKWQAYLPALDDWQSRSYSCRIQCLKLLAYLIQQGLRIQPVSIQLMTSTCKGQSLMRNSCGSRNSSSSSQHLLCLCSLKGRLCAQMHHSLASRADL